MKKIVVWILGLVFLMSLNKMDAQSFTVINETPQIKNYSGLVSLCEPELNQAANSFIQKLNPPIDSNFKIFIYHVYPISAYMKEEDGLNINEKYALNDINAVTSNHISFIIKHGIKTSVEIYFSVHNNLISGPCKGKLNILANQLEKT